MAAPSALPETVRRADEGVGDTGFGRDVAGVGNDLKRSRGCGLASLALAPGYLMAAPSALPETVRRADEGVGDTGFGRDVAGVGNDLKRSRGCGLASLALAPGYLMAAPSALPETVRRADEGVGDTGFGRDVAGVGNDLKRSRGCGLASLALPLATLWPRLRRYRKLSVARMRASVIPGSVAAWPALGIT